jgi:hypothetical protein
MVQEKGADITNFANSTLVGALILNPLLLGIYLGLLLRCHFRRTGISNRAGMLFSFCFMLYFLTIALASIWLNVFPSKVNKEYKWCWQNDETVRALDGIRKWANAIVLGIRVLGILGACL